jgi:hypothetical protein
LDEFMFQAPFDCSTAATMCANQEGCDDAPGRPRQETQYFVHFIQSIHRDDTFEAKLAGGRFQVVTGPSPRSICNLQVERALQGLLRL